MNKITMDINNKQTLELTQFEHDGTIYITALDPTGRQTRDGEAISAGDMVTLINWYRYQKDNGNHALTF